MTSNATLIIVHLLVTIFGDVVNVVVFTFVVGVESEKNNSYKGKKTQTKKDVLQFLLVTISVAVTVGVIVFSCVVLWVVSEENKDIQTHI